MLLGFLWAPFWHLFDHFGPPGAHFGSLGAPLGSLAPLLAAVVRKMWVLWFEHPSAAVWSLSRVGANLVERVGTLKAPLGFLEISWEAPGALLASQGSVF